MELRIATHRQTDKRAIFTSLIKKTARRAHSNVLLAKVAKQIYFYSPEYSSCSLKKHFYSTTTKIFYLNKLIRSNKTIFDLAFKYASILRWAVFLVSCALGGFVDLTYWLKLISWLWQNFGILNKKSTLKNNGNFFCHNATFSKNWSKN